MMYSTEYLKTRLLPPPTTPPYCQDVAQFCTNNYTKTLYEVRRYTCGKVDICQVVLLKNRKKKNTILCDRLEVLMQNIRTHG